jgi:Phosphotransferase enzyme family
MRKADMRIERQSWRQKHETLFGESEFVARYIVPLVPELARNWAQKDWGIEIVRAKASDRMTLRYSFGSSVEIYGKAYFDDSAGRDAYRSLAHFWLEGFAAGSGLEIPEPLGFIATGNLLLMRRAEGTPLSDLTTTGTMEKALLGARLASRWLVKYQAAEIPGLPEESPCEKIEVLKIADALAKLAAERPEYSTLLIDMLHELRAIAPRGNSSPRPVMLHGQFRPAHVFVDGERLTVIDIEKLCLSDPAKDVARFVHVLKKSSLERGGNTECADRVAQELVAEYQRLSPLNLENLPYFRALLALKAFGKLLKSRKPEESVRRVVGEKYRAEFEAVTSKSAIRSVAG